MANNPITDAALAELDQLHEAATKGMNWQEVAQFQAMITEQYQPLRQRLLDAESRLAEAENALARAHGIAARQLSEPADISDSIALVRICTEIEAAKRLREGKNV